MQPLLSICIPAYKRVAYLQRLLDSLVIQSFTGFEVVVSDDSSDASVAELLHTYRSRLQLIYLKNPVALGTPANWNNAIRHAKGEWIKLMHDDDWFIHGEALAQFAAATRFGRQFIFCAYRSYQLVTGAQTVHASSAAMASRLQQKPHLLMAANTIGPPSVTLVHRSVKQDYDERMRWMVDFDCYIRILHTAGGCHYLPEQLVYIGISEEQVTQTAFRNPSVELPEAWLLLEKYGTAPLRNIQVYDAWWRMLRNLGIRHLFQLQTHVPGKQWPVVVHRLLRHQRLLPVRLLRVGVWSKLAMALSYLLNRYTLSALRSVTVLPPQQ